MRSFSPTPSPSLSSNGLTEVDLFLSNQPERLIQEYSDQALASLFNFHLTNSKSFRDQLIEHIWIKYHRIDVVDLDKLLEQDQADNPMVARDYVNGKLISLEQLLDNLERYPPLSLRRFRNYLNIRLIQLNGSPMANPLLITKLNDLSLEIQQRLNRIVNGTRVIL